LVVAGWAPVILSSERFFGWPTLIEDWPDGFWFYKGTLEGVVIQTLAKAWSVLLADLLSASNFSSDNAENIREIGTCFGKPVVCVVDIINNPKNTKI
jgi:hypothetical protein